MKSIYDHVEREPIALRSRARPKMPERLTQLGCGRHQFIRDEGGVYVCLQVGCSTVVRPGQLLYPELDAWYEAAG